MLGLYELIITSRIENVEIISVSDGRQGLQKALEYEPDLMIVEHGLPDIGDIALTDHWLLIDRVRNELCPHVLAVIATYNQRLMGYDIDPIGGIPEEWHTSPLNELLEKPTHPDELVEKVNDLFEKLDRKRIGEQ
jgi:CheY-like chemotaxis protein